MDSTQNSRPARLTWRLPLLSGASICALLVSGMPGLAQAAEANAKAASEVEEVVVTGSLLSSRLESQAQPVDVVSAAELAARGNPSMLNFIKTLPQAGSAPGEANRFDPGATGFAFVNLRALGSQRTLVLMNSQRLTLNPGTPAWGGPGYDINFIPTSALGRVDVLKDGAAATYGSAAIGGVVNFITRRDLDGLVVEGENAFIRGTDGDRFAAATYGKQLESGNLLVTASYRERSELMAGGRDWALKDFASSNGAGGWSGNGNPGNYQDPVTGAYIFRDNGCNELGGQLTRGATINGVGVSTPVNPLLPETGTSATTCRIQYAHFNTIVSPQTTWNLYGEINTQLSDSLAFHAEAAWMKNALDDARSPSNGFSVYPTPISLGGTSGSLRTPDGRLFVPLNIPARNPGLRELYTACAAPLTAAQCQAMAGPNGVDASQSNFRPYFFNANPKNPSPQEVANFAVTSARVSAGLSGDLPYGMHWKSDVTFMQSQRTFHAWEILPTKVQLAVNGFGSLRSDPNSCSPAERTLANAGNTAVGCYYYNPFTNAIPVSGITGAVNPYYRGGSNAAVINNPDVVRGMFGEYKNTQTNQLLLADLIVDGTLDMLELPGGKPEWALGGQLQYESFVLDYSGVTNLDAYPYSDSVDDGSPAGPFRTGATAGAASASNSDIRRRVSAVFGELKIPILDNLEANFAIRREDYGSIGATTNPRVSLRWQALDWLAFRASAGTTFRAPLVADSVSSCALTTNNILGAFRPVSICGNPDIAPETATNYNVGAVAKFGGFRSSIDYYKIEMKDLLTAESPAALVNAMFPGGSSAGCTDPALAALKARFTFIDGVCAPQNYLGLKAYSVNGPPVTTDGIDFQASYGLDDFLIDGSRWDAGVEGTYMLSYDRGQFKLLGAPSVVFDKGAELAGKHNFDQYVVYSKLRFNTYMSFNSGPVTLRWQMTYAQGTSAAPGTAAYRQFPDSSQPVGYRLEPIGQLKDVIRYDLIGIYQAPWGSTLSMSVLNLLDTDPPFAPSVLGYDPTRGDPVGRVVKVGIRHQF